MTRLRHVLEELLTTPPFQTPVIIVLLGSANAERPVATAAAAEIATPAELDLAIVHARLRLADDVPVRLLVEQLGPAVRSQPCEVTHTMDDIIRS